MNKNNNLALFEGQKIRRVWHNNEWWFVVRDVIQVLTNSKNVKEYIKKMRRRDQEISKIWGEMVLQLSIETEKRGTQKISCANLKSILRIIQSIPSPKAEPFKQWLAQVGQERIEEIEDPELGFERLRAIYRAKGYKKTWIKNRIEGIETREGLRGCLEFILWLKKCVFCPQISPFYRYVAPLCTSKNATFGHKIHHFQLQKQIQDSL